VYINDINNKVSNNNNNNNNNVDNNNNNNNNVDNSDYSMKLIKNGKINKFALTLLVIRYSIVIFVVSIMFCVYLLLIH